MAVNREYLEAQIKDLLAREANYLALANSARGAADMARHLLTMIDDVPAPNEEAMTIADLEAMTGGKVESITSLRKDD